MMNVPPSTYIVISRILDIKTVGNVTRDIGLYSQVDLVSRIRGTVYVQQDRSRVITYTETMIKFMHYKCSCANFLKTGVWSKFHLNSNSPIYQDLYT